jgi:hypothetical protein
MIVFFVPVIETANLEYCDEHKARIQQHDWIRDQPVLFGEMKLRIDQPRRSQCRPSNRYYGQNQANNTLHRNQDTKGSKKNYGQQTVS